MKKMIYQTPVMDEIEIKHESPLMIVSEGGIEYGDPSLNPSE